MSNNITIQLALDALSTHPRTLEAFTALIASLHGEGVTVTPTQAAPIENPTQPAAALAMTAPTSNFSPAAPILPPTPPAVPVAPAAAPVTMPQAPAAMIPPSAPTVASAPGVVPTAAPGYTLEQLAHAGGLLAGNGKMAEVQALMKQYDIQTIADLPQPQLGAFAAELRALGAQI